MAYLCESGSGSAMKVQLGGLEVGDQNKESHEIICSPPFLIGYIVASKKAVQQTA